MRSLILHVDKLGAPNGLGPLEARVMEVAWSIEDWVSVSDVLKRLNDKQGKGSLAYSTVKAVLSNLVDKRHLRKRAIGKANAFLAVKSRDEFQRTVVSHVIGPMMRTQRPLLLALLASELAANDEMYVQFERLLAEERASKHQLVFSGSPVPFRRRRDQSGRRLPLETHRTPPRDSRVGPKTTGPLGARD